MLPDSADIDRRLEFFSELLSCQNHFYRWVYDSDGFLQQTNCKDLALNKLFVKKFFLPVSSGTFQGKFRSVIAQFLAESFMVRCL